MKLYLAGPMTGYPELNFPLFHAETARLRALGFQIVNPAELNEGNDGDWLACMRVDIAAIMTEKCEGIALLPGWENSRGAPIEHRLIRDLGLRVFMAAHLVGLAGEFPVLSRAAVVCHDTNRAVA
ncbi:DUF4406 domain-containing protein [Paraburkholderia xenovorans]|uniref:DUF4406 domain-containing protein n=1 Tax=Paraburkholderia xenovorans TaxID=36873 RepID=UPI001559502A|nr:DUF4406 domain-containing protein [Paraburkholderia xenovorans]NPT38564.1 DUF4406 domain-containing protein [Paraburkholderia xenovorans]